MHESLREFASEKWELHSLYGNYIVGMGTTWLRAHEREACEACADGHFHFGLRGPEVGLVGIGGREVCYGLSVAAA